ncbi:hypothetical protein SAMN04488135_107204 [Pollutimonas bauzanensis]|uniref:Uncharacterized protein n=2 Tax=Pollutimonas bauzanensis TaxID=658167 RepID=A0A1M5XZ07_9BURK|nr:hypothetical protein SAMN04488135_107204 [Pollutimonas bauzanensis]
MHAGASANASEMQKNEARAAALELLRRSVAFKHDRLAIIRLVDAVKLDAAVESDLWSYCATVANALMDRGQLQKLQARS